MHQSFVLTLSAAAAMLAAGTANATLIHYSANLSGPNESPANASPGTGFANVDVDTTLHTMHLHVEFSGLIGTTTASHIHGATAVALTGTAGVATTTPTFAGFPLGVTAGVYDITLDTLASSSYNPAFVTANGGTPASAEAALFAALAADKSYLNVHSSAFPGGEIRGFLQVPSPAAIGLLGLGGLVVGRRRR